MTVTDKESGAASTTASATTNPFIIQFTEDNPKWDWRRISTVDQMVKMAAAGKMDHYISVAIEYLIRGFIVTEVAETVFNVSQGSSKDAFFAIVEYLSKDPDFMNRRYARLDELDLKSLWSEKKSVISLLKIVNDPFEKATPKLNAIRELNMLYNLTMIDDKGNTRKSDWNDFYNQ